jgi:HAE1 family hydrophobic/amphiphilic exporter-1
MCTLSLVVLGYISLTRIPLEYAPDLNFPSMSVNVDYPSSSPEEIERDVTRPVEEVLATLSGVKAISSRSYGNRSYVRMEFDYGTNMELMAIRVRDRIDIVRPDLPEDVERIETRRWSSDDWEILDYRLTWLGADQSDLMTAYKNVILPRLQRIEGVGNVEIEGVDEKALLVQVDQGSMRAHNLDIRTLNRAIQNNNINVSAGFVNDGGRRVAVRSIGEFQDVSQIRQLPLETGLVLDDVANVTYDYPERRYFERIDGRNAVSIEIRKSSTANLVETANLVKAEMEIINDDIGRDRLKVHLSRDQSERVTKSIRDLGLSALFGGFLAISIIYLFLRNFQSTLIIGMSIPISAFCVFTIMYLLRQFFQASITLNMVSMMGLMVSIGMLVDPAVVALENIYRKRFDQGLDAESAAIEGSAEISVPILAATMTTVCVFVPLVFTAGSSRSMWMRDFAITVCIAVIASLCIALTLIPLAGSRAFRDDSGKSDRYLKLILGSLAALGLGYVIHDAGLAGTSAVLREWTTTVVDALAKTKVTVWGGLAALTLLIVFLKRYFRGASLRGTYARMIARTLHYRWTTVAISCLILGLGFELYANVEKRPFSWRSTRRVEFTVETPRSFGLEQTLELFTRIENILMPLKETLDVESVRTRFSDRWGSRVSLNLTSGDKSTLTTDEIKKRVLDLLPKDEPGIRFKAGGSRGGSASGVGVELRGRNSTVLAVLAEEIRDRMEGIEDVTLLETSLESGAEEIRVSVNRTRASRYGLSPRRIASDIATSLGTRGSSKYKTEDGEINITVQLREEDRATLSQLRNATFETDEGKMVSLGALASFDLRRGPDTIERQDRMSTVEIFANTDQKRRLAVGREMAKRMQGIALPSGYSWQMDRRFRRMAEEVGETDFTLILAAILIYIIMASLFESYVHPFTIMFAITFAFTGVAAGLYLTDTALDSNATYGLLILFGIVVNNGIVLVDHINRYRKQGYYRKDAIILGGQDRIRPILMTAATTILGLMPLVIPMLYGTAEGQARIWGPIGLVIVSGLSVSTVMTLILLPTVYSLMDDLAGSARRVLAAARTV